MLSIYLNLFSSGIILFSSVQFLSRVRLFVTPWTAARQASLSIINSRNLLKLMSIKSVMPSNHLILCRPLLLPPSQSFPASVFSKSSQLFASGGQSIGASASVSVLPMNIQVWFPLGWTSWISLQSKGLSRDFSKSNLLLKLENSTNQSLYQYITELPHHLNHLQAQQFGGSRGPATAGPGSKSGFYSKNNGGI